MDNWNEKMLRDIHGDSIRLHTYDVLGKLPDPFVFEDGTPLRDPADWEKRRAEIFRPAVDLQYGGMPPQPEFLEVTLANDTDMKCYTILTGTRKKPVRFTMTLFLPKGKGPFPAVVDGDLCFNYAYDPKWLSAFTDHGIMLALFNRTDLAADVQTPVPVGQIYETYPEGGFSLLSAWAWGYSRCVDALEKIGIADMSCIVFTGHSRGGKTAALAGATDLRAAIVNPNETCAGGCGCYRVHMEAETEFGEIARSETLADIYGRFPLWFGKGMREYTDREAELPFDLHYLKALIAPRTLFVSEACSDIWANPVGSWQTTMAAKEVYRFLGAEDRLYWYFRSGLHYHTVKDVEMLVNVILHQRDGAPLSGDFFRLPFRAPELIFDWRAPSPGK